MIFYVEIHRKILQNKVKVNTKRTSVLKILEITQEKVLGIPD